MQIISEENIKLKERIERRSSDWKKTLPNALHLLENVDSTKKRAAFVRWKNLENLEKNIIEFEGNFTRNGGKIIYAPGAEDVQNELKKIIEKNKEKNIFTHESSTTRELNFNNFSLKAETISRLETDFENSLQQRINEPPKHPVHAAYTHSREETISKFHKKNSIIRQQLFDELLIEHENNLEEKSENNLLIISPQYVVADTGNIVIAEDEGTLHRILIQSDTIIFLVGIDTVLHQTNDAEILLSLNSIYSNQTSFPRFVSFLPPNFHNKKNKQVEVYVILIDNNRTETIADTNKRELLWCIGCGACHNVCPVYKLAGFNDKNGYSGPIELAKNIGQKNEKNSDKIFTSTLCGACNEICPVNIDVKKLLLENRNKYMQNGTAGMQENYVWSNWKKMMMRRKKMNQSMNIKSFMIKTFFKRAWGEDRELPKLTSRSFNEMWRDQFGEGEE